MKTLMTSLISCLTLNMYLNLLVYDQNILKLSQKSLAILDYLQKSSVTFRNFQKNICKRSCGHFVFTPQQITTQHCWTNKFILRAPGENHPYVLYLVLYTPTSLPMMPQSGTQTLVVSRADKIVISALFASSLIRNNILYNLPRTSEIFGN